MTPEERRKRREEMFGPEKSVHEPVRPTAPAKPPEIDYGKILPDIRAKGFFSNAVASNAPTQPDSTFMPEPSGRQVFGRTFAPPPEAPAPAIDPAKKARKALAPRPKAPDYSNATPEELSQQFKGISGMTIVRDGKKGYYDPRTNQEYSSMRGAVRGRDDIDPTRRAELESARKKEGLDRAHELKKLEIGTATGKGKPRKFEQVERPDTYDGPPQYVDPYNPTRLITPTAGVGDSEIDELVGMGREKAREYLLTRPESDQTRIRDKMRKLGWIK